MNKGSIKHKGNISKPDYLLFWECYKNAWLKIHHPEIFHQAGLSESNKAIIETGDEVEEYARKLFLAGILVVSLR